jgi:hypothetical protein
MPSVVDTSVTPRSVSALTVSKMCIVLRPSRSSFHTRHHVGECLRYACRFKCGVLLFESLGDGADASIAKSDTGASVAGQFGSVSHHSVERYFCEIYF